MFMQLMQQKHTSIDYNQMRNLTTSMIQLFKLLNNSNQNHPGTARHHSAQYEDGSALHQDQNARAYYHHTYFEACDLLSAELKDRFETSIHHLWWP